MKKIRLKNSSNPDKSSIYQEQNRYTIFLGNGLTAYYSTNKDRNYALAEINRQLNSVIFELNEMWIFSFSEYRRLWFYLPSITYTSSEATIVEINNSIRSRMELLADRSSWVNGNAFSFKYLFEIINGLSEQMKIFIEIRKRKKQFIESKILEVKLKTLSNINQELCTLNVLPKYSTSKKNKVSENSFRLEGPASNTSPHHYIQPVRSGTPAR